MTEKEKKREILTKKRERKAYERIGLGENRERGNEIDRERRREKGEE